MKRRVGIYLRVSTDGQTTENQRRELEAVAARSGWEVVDFYEDAGISGSNGREKRPGLDRLLKDATARRINMIAACSVDRLGRSLQHLVELLNELQALHCNLYLHQQVALVRVNLRIARSHAALNLDGAFHRIDHARSKHSQVSYIGVCQLPSLPVWQGVQWRSSSFLKYLQNRV